MDLSRFLDPKIDLTFHKIFGIEKNKNILIHFLNDIMEFTEISTIEEVEFLSTILVPEIACNKQSIVDVLCRDSDGNRFVIEMQVVRDTGFETRATGFEKRAQIYAAKAYSRKSDKSGKYIDLQKVFFIAISDCTLYPKEVDYISTHNIHDIKIDGHYLKDLEFIFIELPKFAKNKVEQLTSMVERWCFFFKYAEDTTDEDLRKIAEEMPVIKLAYDELDKFQWHEKDLLAYEGRVMNLQIEENILAYKIDEAKIECKIEVAKRMLADNFDVNTIVKLTRLPLVEIEKLQKN